MKSRTFAVSLSFITVLLFAPQSQLRAQNNPLITMDEFGNGTIQFPLQPPNPLPGVMMADPGPGGRPNALTYNLLGPPNLVAGDLFLIEPGNTNFSDVIRFNPAGTGGNAGYPASVVFYSDNGDGVDAPADVGSPFAFYANQLFVQEVGTEGNNGYVYTPVAGQPGYVAGFSVTYNILSDVPEPTTFAMTGLGVAALIISRRRK